MTTTDTQDSIASWQRHIHAWANSRGWWENADRNFGELLMLATTEIAEAFEEWRDGHDPAEVYYATDKYGLQKPEGVAIELADVLIRLFDTAERYGIDLEEMIRIKMAYNAERPYRHGGKRA